MTEPFDRDLVHWHNRREVRCRDQSDLMAETTDKKRLITCAKCAQTLDIATTMLDLYEAMGMTVARETGSVVLTNKTGKFKIELEVSFLGITANEGAMDVELAVQLAPRLVWSGLQHFEKTITLPLEQIKIVKEQ